MQSLPWKIVKKVFYIKRNFKGAFVVFLINFIADKRATDTGQMHSYLMSASGFQITLHQCGKIFKRLDGLVMGNGVFAAGCKQGHFFAVEMRAPDVAGNCSA